METMIIKHPSEGTLGIITRRSDIIRDGDNTACVEAIGLVQGKMIEMKKQQEFR